MRSITITLALLSGLALVEACFDEAPRIPVGESSTGSTTTGDDPASSSDSGGGGAVDPGELQSDLSTLPAGCWRT